MVSRSVLEGNVSLVDKEMEMQKQGFVNFNNEWDIPPNS
jgi:hypothetical protein